MKLLLNSKNQNVAHIDIISDLKGVLNTYVDQVAFWSSQVPIATQDITPPADYDTLTDEALVLLGPDWEIREITKS
jgi:hypothetical protein